MKVPAVRLVIPTWNGKEHLLQCLEALSQQTYKDFATVIVVNGSRDGTVEALSEHPRLQMIVNRKNVGFAAAVNQGIRTSREDYVAVLNDDAFPETTWLEALVQAIESDVQIGACASLMVFAHQPNRVQSAGIAMDRAAIAWDRLRCQPVTDAQEACEVFGASAGAALYRRSMLEQIGLFDERFFAYLEDVDLAWRAQSAGWRCQYVPDALVRHLTSASLGENAPLKKQLKARNKVWMVVKNAPAKDFPLILFFDMAAVLYTLAKKDLHPLIGRLKGWMGIRPFLGDRHPGRPRNLEALVPPHQVPQRWGE